MGEKITPTPIAPEEQAEFDRTPQFLLEFYQKRLTGMSNILQTTQIKQISADLFYRINHLKKQLKNDK